MAVSNNVISNTINTLDIIGVAKNKTQKKTNCPNLTIASQHFLNTQSVSVSPIGLQCTLHVHFNTTIGLLTGKFCCVSVPLNIQTGILVKPHYKQMRFTAEEKLLALLLYEALHNCAAWRGRGDVKQQQFLCITNCFDPHRIPDN